MSARDDLTSPQMEAAVIDLHEFLRSIPGSPMHGRLRFPTVAKQMGDLRTEKAFLALCYLVVHSPESLREYRSKE